MNPPPAFNPNAGPLDGVPETPPAYAPGAAAAQPGMPSAPIAGETMQARFSKRPKDMMGIRRTSSGVGAFKWKPKVLILNRDSLSYTSLGDPHRVKHSWRLVDILQATVCEDVKPRHDSTPRFNFQVLKVRKSLRYIKFLQHGEFWEFRTKDRALRDQWVLAINSRKAAALVPYQAVVQPAVYGYGGGTYGFGGGTQIVQGGHIQGAQVIQAQVVQGGYGAQANVRVVRLG